MTIETDLHVEWAKLEDEFLELNLLADADLQKQLEAVRVEFDCQFALLNRLQQPERRLMPPLEE